MDKSVDTFEQNKHFLSAFFPSYKNTLFVDSETPLSPFSMLKCAPWTLPFDYNIEKGRGVEMLKLETERLTCSTKQGFLGECLTTFVHDCLNYISHIVKLSLHYHCSIYSVVLSIIV